MARSTFVYLTGMSILSGISAALLDTVYEWKFVDYDWPSDESKALAIAAGEYNLTVNVPYDVDLAPDGRYFVTTVRDKGVPATLSTVSDKNGDGGPLLRPYPDWSWTNTSNCDNIIAVYRVATDHCNRLWVLDTGKIGDNFVCSAKLMVFDMTNDKLLKSIIIPDNVARNTTTGLGLLVTPILEFNHYGCDEVTVYMADVEGYGMIIWSGRTDSWRLQSDSFRADKDAASFTVANESFYIEDGLLGMTIVYFPNGSPELYYRPLASYYLYSASTADLKSTRYWSTPIQYRNHGKLLNQAVGLATSHDGIIFYGVLNYTAIACWRPKSPTDTVKTTIIDQDTDVYQFPSGIKIIGYNKQDVLLIFINRYQKVAAGTLNFNETNFRILSKDVDTLVKGTACDCT